MSAERPRYLFPGSCHHRRRRCLLHVIATLNTGNNLTSLANVISQRNLSETLNSAPGLTIFAPTNAALTAAQANLTSSNYTASDIQTILAGHILNGTVAYGDELSAK